MTVQNATDKGPDQPENMNEISAEQDYAPVTNLRPTVGDEMRMRREEAGHTVADLAEALRIQRRYLEALEDGRLEDLPGTVYALGFLRSYAEYYDLNGDAIVTRFKEETAGLRQEQEYTLPEPIEEARVPTAAIVIVAIILAVGAYVAWYSLRPQEADLAGAVPEVPARLALTPEPTPLAVPTLPAEPAPLPVPAATAPQPELPATPPASADRPVASQASAAVTEAASPPAPQPAPAPAEVASAPVPAPAPEPPPAAAEVAVTPPQPPAPTEADTPVETAVHTPQIYGTSNADSRIVIIAAEDSWIEIMDPDGNRLVSRTLRAGDRYRVPDRVGLLLVTGNAGGLKFTVDGVPAPTIGDVGIVRKDVKLDPGLLKAGRAWR